MADVQPKSGDASGTSSADVSRFDRAFDIPADMVLGGIDIGDGVVLEDWQPPEVTEHADGIEEEEVTEGDEEAASSEDEPIEESEEPADDEPVDDQQEESVATSFDPNTWDGNVDSLPPEVKPLAQQVLKNMERGVQMKFQELARMRKEAQEEREKYIRELSALAKGEGRNLPAAEGPPPPPAEDATREQWLQWSRENARYFAQEAVKEKVGDLPDYSSLAERVTRQEADRRFAQLTSHPEFSDAIGMKMAEMAEQDRYWTDALYHDDKLSRLFSAAQKEVRLSELQKQLEEKDQAVKKAEAVEVKRKASSANRAVSRSVSRKATPAENFADKNFSFNDREGWNASKKAILDKL